MGHKRFNKIDPIDYNVNDSKCPIWEGSSFGKDHSESYVVLKNGLKEWVEKMACSMFL